MEAGGVKLVCREEFVKDLNVILLDCKEREWAQFVWLVLGYKGPVMELLWFDEEECGKFEMGDEL